MKLIHGDLTYQLRGIFYQTYNALGPGFDETLYQQVCFEKCTSAGIEAKKEHDVRVIYKGHEVATLFLDLFVEDKVIVEFKAVDAIVPYHKSQIICYLLATNRVIGLLTNFSVDGVDIQRLANFKKAVETIRTADFLNESKLTDFSLTDASNEMVFKVIGGICEVWNELGYGYLESIYYRALEFELGLEKFSFDLEEAFDVFLEGKRLGTQKIKSVLNRSIWIVLTSTTKPHRGLARKIRSILNKTPLSCAILANLSGTRPKIQIIQ